MPRPLITAVLPGLLAACCFLAPAAANAQASVTGQWTKAPNLPIVPIHNVLLPNGKIMMVGKNLAQTLWDPLTNSASALPSAGYDLFCYGHAYLADGRVLAAGGHIADFVGLANASIYNPATNSWSPVPNMNAGRWYPTVTTLANGDALVVSGQIDTSVGINPLPQVYQAATNTWRDLTSAQLNQPMYPEMFLAPNGKVIDVGPTDVTRYLDTSGTGAWTLVGNRKYGWRDYGSAVMYDTGKIMQVGGGQSPPTAGAEVIDLNVASPAWRVVQSMQFARRHLNATLLPDGTVLATGGTSGSGHNNATTPVFAAELWNPATETWTTLASGSVPRLYHSAALLLPDGRVVVTGGDGYPDVEIFSPPYLFKGTRPTISGVPTSLGYGQRFTIQSPNSADIRKVTLIRLAAVTHAFDENQRLNTLQFTAGTGTLDITTPANANLAPPGHYMLFVVDSTGVPSVGSLVQIGGAGTTPPPPAPAPALSSISPNSATAGGPAFTLTVNGSNFVSGATVRWNGAARSTTFVGGTQVRAAIPSSDIAAAGTANVSVANPDGSVSGVIPFSVSSGPTAPPPALSSLSPSSATAGGSAFTLTVNGSNFVSGAAVRWNGAARSTTFVSATQVRAAIASTDIAAAGTAQVSVANPGGTVSGALPFTVSSPTASAPALSSLSPGSATAGGPAFTLTVYGSNFVSGATVLWNGVTRTTTFVRKSRLRAAIPATDIAAAGTASVSVANPGGGVSGTLPFTVSGPTAPAPALSSLSPSSATAGGPAFTLTVNGSNFVSGAAVRWNGSARSTTYVSAAQVRAAIPATDIAAAGTANISVLNPGGSVSGVLPFAVAGAAATTYTVTVTRNGSAPSTGTITSNPAGISCGGTCSAAFASGGTVTLTAAASSGGVFAGWSGACTGTGACTLTMNGNKAVTATFNTASTTACPYPVWVGTIRYMPGDKVTRLGNYYVATDLSASVWNENSPPEWTPDYWDPTTCP